METLTRNYHVLLNGICRVGKRNLTLENNSREQQVVMIELSTVVLFIFYSILMHGKLELQMQLENKLIASTLQ